MTKIHTKIWAILTAPFQAIDDWTAKGLDFTLTEAELIADLDPGWLEWRATLGDTAEQQPLAA